MYKLKNKNNQYINNHFQYIMNKLKNKLNK